MIKRLTAIVSTILLVFMVSLSLVLLVPHLFGVKTYAVLSGSMEPVVHTGSLAFVKGSNVNEVSPGDIITYKVVGDKNILVTHRVVSIDETQKRLITKGDANEVNDGSIAFDSLVGKMLFSIPILGFLTVFLKTKLGMLLAISLAVLMILLPSFSEIRSKGDSQQV